eukprot:NODE_26355_length_554_cov_1.147541.p4 GENE.NODE_26355_length_554_cov_1.147541~~NODE_26355_length_554_cov_1.147541.p4  ORF type:complete len:54 (-),score=4.13 NODE_26355_length_554_cov_1.147541:321-482(-)
MAVDLCEVRFWIVTWSRPYVQGRCMCPPTGAAATTHARPCGAAAWAIVAAAAG